MVVFFNRDLRIMADKKINYFFRKKGKGWRRELSNKPYMVHKNYLWFRQLHNKNPQPTDIMEHYFSVF